MGDVAPRGRAELRETLPGLSAPAAPPGSEGHRERIRARLLATGPESLADHEILEVILFAVPRRDTKALAHALLAKFKTFPATLAAPIRDLRAVDGLGDAGIAALKIVHGAAVRLALAEVREQPLLNNYDRLMDYLQAAMARDPIEQFRVLYMDSKNKLLSDEVQSRGTVNHPPVYPREVIKRALELHATAMILVHNHPSGDPEPSRDDIDMTREIFQAATLMNVVLHDHLIVGNGTYLSFRSAGLLPTA